MSVANQVKETALDAFIAAWDHGHLVPRVIAEIKRVNESMPNATGKEKRARVFADWNIIFDDLIEPVGEHVIRLLIEIGLEYLAIAYPVTAPVVAIVKEGINAELNK